MSQPQSTLTRSFSSSSILSDCKDSLLCAAWNRGLIDDRVLFYSLGRTPASHDLNEILCALLDGSQPDALTFLYRAVGMQVPS